jgi:hypothetical protein
MGKGAFGGFEKVDCKRIPGHFFHEKPRIQRKDGTGGEEGNPSGRKKGGSKTATVEAQTKSATPLGHQATHGRNSIWQGQSRVHFLGRTIRDGP